MSLLSQYTFNDSIIPQHTPAKISNVDFFLFLKVVTPIHFLYQLNPAWGRRACPSCHWVRGRVHPGHVARPSQGHTETNETKKHVCLINLICMFFGGGRKPKYLERTHTYTGRTCKLHEERSQLGFKPETLLL